MASKRSGVTGAKRTARNIRRLPRTMRRPVAESSRDSLKPMLAAAKKNMVENGSRKRGVLYRGMKIIQKRAGRGSVETVISATGKAIGIAHLVEFGTEPHFQPKRGVMHPGADPKPFLTPAFLDGDDEAMRIFSRRISIRLDQQIARMRSS